MNICEIFLLAGLIAPCLCIGIQQQNYRIQQCSETLKGKTQKICMNNVLQCYKGMNVSMSTREHVFKATVIPLFAECSLEHGEFIAKMVAKACLASNFSPMECGHNAIVNEAIKEMIFTIEPKESSSYHESLRIEISDTGKKIFTMLPKVLDMIPLLEKALNMLWLMQKQKPKHCSKDQYCDEESSEKEVDKQTSQEDVQGKDLNFYEDIEVIDRTPKVAVEKCPEEIEQPLSVSEEKRREVNDEYSQVLSNSIQTAVSEIKHFLVIDSTKDGDFLAFRNHLQSMLSDCQLKRLNCCVLPKTEFMINPNDLNSFNSKLFTYKIFQDLKPDLRNAFIQAAINFKIPDSCDIDELSTQLADNCVEYLHKMNRIYL